jgi:hypothetical protein
MKIRNWAGLLPLLTVATACVSPDQQTNLEGQWVIRMTAKSFRNQPVSDRDIAGVLVFDNTLPLWAPEETLGLTPPYSKGRMFAPLARLTDGSVSDTLPRPYYRPNGGPNLADEVVAKTAGSNVNFVLAPGVIGGRFEFSGKTDGDTVRGNWKMPPHPTGMDGSFKMWRTPNQAALDSAQSWARRGVGHKPELTGVPLDTL